MNDLLDIFLITFNRRNYLEKTLEKIFSDDSPLMKYSITIFDNNSNDGTDVLCKQYASRFPNLTYVKNIRNVGLAGNICKAMEHASKKYYWIICDNDEIDFTIWPDIEKAMENDYDLIMASVDYNCDAVKDKRAFVLAQSTFLPACIYKTKYLTDEVMVYSLTDIHTILPHVCVACNIVNNDGRIFIPQKSVVTLTHNVVIKDLTKYNFDRIITSNGKKFIHERTKNCNFPAGIASSFNSLRDEKLRKMIIHNFTDKKYLNGYGPFINFRKIANDEIIFKSKMADYIWCQFVDLLPLKDKINLFFHCFLSSLNIFYSVRKTAKLRIHTILGYRFITKRRHKKRETTNA